MPCYGATRNRLRTRRPGPPRAVSYATRLKQKKPSPPIGMGRPVFHEAKRKVLIAPTPKARPGGSLRSGRRCRGEGFEIIQRGDALSAEEFAEVGYLDIALARAADMNLVPRFVFRREIVQFLGIFLKTERALDALGPERRPAVRTRMHPLSALVDVPALVARRLRPLRCPMKAGLPHTGQCPCCQTSFCG